MRTKIRSAVKILSVAILAAALGPAGMDAFALWPTDGMHRPNVPGLLYWHGGADQKRIALTFDDGPSEPFTSEVLDILKAHHVKATFFVCGSNVQRHPELARRIVGEGHAIGNHSFSHLNLARLSSRHLRREMLVTEDIVEEATGTRPTLFRAPFGRLNSRVLRLANEMGCTAIQWTISPRDWSSPAESKIVSRTLSQVKNGAIILLHDGSKGYEQVNRLKTVEALPHIIDELEARGFELVTVPELLGLNAAKNQSLASAGSYQVSRRK